MALALNHGFTFTPIRGEAAHCHSCKLPEREHVWICDGCGTAFSWEPDGIFPDTQGHKCQLDGVGTGAMLVCPHKVAIVVGDVS